MKDAQDYIKEIGREIQSLLNSGNGLEESATSVLTQHVASLEENVSSLKAIREMPTKAQGIENLVRSAKEIEQKITALKGQIEEVGAASPISIQMEAIVMALEWVLFRKESV